MHPLAYRAFGMLPRLVRNTLIRIGAPTFTSGAGVAMTDDEGRVLLVRLSYGSGWALPGGLLRRNEQPRAAAIREVGEELGITIELNGTHVSLLLPDRQHFSFVFRHHLDAAHAAGIAPSSPEIIAAEWFTLDALPLLHEHTDVFLDAVGLTPGPQELLDQ